jgi:hypothetical protein
MKNDDGLNKQSGIELEDPRTCGYVDPDQYKGRESDDQDEDE